MSILVLCFITLLLGDLYYDLTGVTSGGYACLQGKVKYFLPAFPDNGDPFASALDNPLVVTLPQRRLGPENPQWKITPTEGATVPGRIDQKESVRMVAKDYGVSYEAIQRVLRAARQG